MRQNQAQEHLDELFEGRIGPATKSALRGRKPFNRRFNPDKPEKTPMSFSGLISLMMKCPCCVERLHRWGIYTEDFMQPKLHIANDLRTKDWSNILRKKPRKTSISKEMGRDLCPADLEIVEEWQSEHQQRRANKVRMSHEPSGLVIRGVPDDLWTFRELPEPSHRKLLDFYDPDRKMYVVVDYKGTYTTKSLRSRFHRKQLEFYLYMLRQTQKIPLSSTVYIIYTLVEDPSEGLKDDEGNLLEDVSDAFKLPMNWRVVAYHADTSWVDDMLCHAKGILSGEEEAEPDPWCDPCRLRTVGRFTLVEESVRKKLQEVDLPVELQTDKGEANHRIARLERALEWMVASERERVLAIMKKESPQVDTFQLMITVRENVWQRVQNCLQKEVLVAQCTTDLENMDITPGYRHDVAAEIPDLVENILTPFLKSGEKVETQHIRLEVAKRVPLILERLRVVKKLITRLSRDEKTEKASRSRLYACVKERAKSFQESYGFEAGLKDALADHLEEHLELDRETARKDVNRNQQVEVWLKSLNVSDRKEKDLRKKIRTELQDDPEQDMGQLKKRFFLPLAQDRIKKMLFAHIEERAKMPGAIDWLMSQVHPVTERLLQEEELSPYSAERIEVLEELARAAYLTLFWNARLIAKVRNELDLLSIPPDVYDDLYADVPGLVQGVYDDLGSHSAIVSHVDLARCLKQVALRLEDLLAK